MYSTYIACVLLGLCICSVHTAAVPGYKEHLFLRPLPVSSLLASFSFRTHAPTSSFETQNFPLFPRSLGQILQHTHTKELHLRFSSGRWDSEHWGARPRSGRQEGGTGVELWAWLEADSDEQAEARWLTLMNALSGLFCASLNFIDSTRTVRPAMTFQPQGDHVNSSFQYLHLLHGNLPGEVVCTENLTPFLKLLPCKGKVGVSSLLDGHKMFDSSWQSMAIDVRPVCSKGSSDCYIEMEQSVDMAISIERAKRPRDDPIPRPAAIENISCDPSKYYAGYGDSCFPLKGPSSPSFSLSDVFGRFINGACPYADQTVAGSESLCLAIPSDRHVNVETSGKYSEKKKDGLKCFQIPTGVPFNLGLDEHNTTEPALVETSLIRVERTLTGYGQQHGGLTTVFSNLSPNDDIEVSYFEPTPWFMRIFSHTLRAEISTADGNRWTLDSSNLLRKTIYRPAVDRIRASHLEIRLDIPAASTLTLTHDFEKTILRYSEYPSDANRGFSIPAAVVRVFPIPGHAPSESFIRTTSLLLYLPTPDFSMPYNVIILTSTVIALAFGTVFNVMVRRFVAKDEGPTGGLLQNFVRQLIAKLRSKLTTNKSKKE